MSSELKRARKKTVKKTKEDFDIIHIDEKIKIKFEEDAKNLTINIKEKKELEKKSKPENTYTYQSELDNKLEILNQKIENGSNPAVLSEYIARSFQILENYEKYMRKPIKKSFMSKSIENKKREDLFEMERVKFIAEYLEVAKEYIPIKNGPKIIHINGSCLNCESKDSRISESENICLGCGLTSEKISDQTQFKDIERVNIVQKYKYGMKTHFKDTIAQFQGKQNKFISPKIFNELEEKFDAYGFKDPGKTRHEMYRRVTKDNIKMILQITKNSKHYEDITLLHHYYTGIPTPDISRFEDDLLKDFSGLEDAYKRLSEEEKCYRINFLNNQEVLYKLLKRRGYKCKSEDFSLLKLGEKKIEHDEIYEKLCRNMGWE